MPTSLVSIILFLLFVFFIYRSWLGHKEADKNLTLGRQFLEENQDQDGIITTPSGLQYKILVQGQGDKTPEPNSTVKVHYHGTLIDSTVFDSSIERDKPIEFRLGLVISGWQEGLLLMVEGQKNRIYIPSHLAYGRHGVGAIPRNSTLIFDVELLEIIPITVNK